LLNFYSFVKVILWLVTGIFFGSSSFLLVFASKSIFGQAIHLSTLIHYDYVMFLCVCLMGGASADHFCSRQGGWTYRLFPIVCCLLALSVLYYIFNPFSKTNPHTEFLKWMSIVYGAITFGFCWYVKGTLFYDERTNQRNLTEFQ
jgi:hypothetical protein